MIVSPYYIPSNLVNNPYFQERKLQRNITYIPLNNTYNMGIYRNNLASNISQLNDYYNNLQKANYINNNYSGYPIISQNRILNYNPNNNYIIIQNYRNPNDNYGIMNANLVQNNRIYITPQYYVKQNLNPQLPNQLYIAAKPRIDLNVIDNQNHILNNRVITPNYSYLNLSNEQGLNNNLNYSPNNYQSNINTTNYNDISQSNLNTSLSQNQIFNENQINNNAPLNNGITDISNNINESKENDINNLVNIKITDSNMFQNNYNSNIDNNTLATNQNNNNNNSQNNLLNENINNPINPNLNHIINPDENQYINQNSNQISNQNINDILNNNIPSFKETSIDKDVITIDLDEYINQSLSPQKNQYEQMNSFNVEENKNVEQTLNEQQNLNQNELISPQKDTYLNSNEGIQKEERKSLGFNLENELISQTETMNQFLNESSSQPTIFSNELNNNLVNEGGILKNYSTLSRPGSDKNGMTKTNQDSLFSRLNINNVKDFNIFGVLDGHGPSGHLISQFAAQFIQNYIINNPELKNLSKTEEIYFKLKENNYNIIKQAFILIDNQLKSQNFDVKESGSTCVLVAQIGNHLICANVGDSRAIVVFDENNDKNLNQLKAIPLSIDFKPDMPEERSRILMSGGVVEQATNCLGVKMGPFRIFAPGEDYPGLAMSRSIGDLEGKNFGVTAEPGIIEYNISENTKYVVLGSDGIWEFLSNEHVKNLGKAFYLNNDPKGFVEELITQSLIEWRCNDSIVDDSTVIALYF